MEEEWRQSIRVQMRSFNATVREKFEEAAESRQQLQDDIEEKLDDMKIGMCLVVDYLRIFSISASS